MSTSSKISPVRYMSYVLTREHVYILGISGMNLSASKRCREKVLERCHPYAVTTLDGVRGSGLGGNSGGSEVIIQRWQSWERLGLRSADKSTNACEGL